MLRIFVLSALLAVSGSRAGTVKRLPIDNHHRIVNGVDVKPGEYPSQLSLQYFNSHNCGASILSANWALTAAHCVYGSATSGISLVAGTVILHSGGTEHNAERIIIHEGYNRSDSWLNDIAVIEVETPFNIDNINVKPVGLPSQGQQTADGETATVIGWGRIYQSGPLSPELQKVDILTVNQQKCENIYASIGYDIHPGQICADVPEGNKGSCNGDSGGPLFVNNQVVGLVSWAVGCAVPGYPTVYTRVAEYRDWIKQQTGV